MRVAPAIYRMFRHPDGTERASSLSVRPGVPRVYLGGQIGAVVALIGVALFLWSVLPAGAQTGLFVESITANRVSSSQFVVSVTFNRPVTGAPQIPTEFYWSLSYIQPGSTTQSFRDASVRSISGSVLTLTYHTNVPLRSTAMTLVYDSESADDIVEDGNSNNRLASFSLPIPYTRPAPVSSGPPSPDPSNLARSAVQWGPVGGVHPVPAGMGEVSSSKPRDARGSLDLSAIAATVSEELRRESRGFYITVLVERAADQRHLLRQLDYEPVRGSPLLKVQIWHVYRHAGRGTNTVELLGEVFGGRAADRLAEPVEICLPAPLQDAERARIAVTGRLDWDWTILETRLSGDGRLCAETTRVAWFTIVLAPEE